MNQREAEVSVHLESTANGHESANSGSGILEVCALVYLEDDPGHFGL